MWMESVARPWLILELTGSAVALGLVSAARMVPMLIFGLLAGVIADRFGRHDETAIIAFIVSGIVFVVVAQAGLQMVLVVALFTIAGLAQGILRPARDMMVRAMAPKGAVGRVFGYVSTGIALGSGIAPVLFGWMVDKGVSAWIFWLLAGLSLLGILIVLVQKRSG